MRADTRTVSIEAPAHHVVTFLEDPTNLPRWAVGFAKTVRQTASGWIVHTIHTATCRAGHVFYRPGETGEAMFLLKEGAAQLYRLSPDGRKLRVLRRGDRGFGDLHPEPDGRPAADSRVSAVRPPAPRDHRQADGPG